jgi:hypothetical protein
MRLTFLGNRYETETSAITGMTTAVTAKYRGIEYQTTSTLVSAPTTCDRKYRGVAYY